jgi:hypothetical protein
VNERCYAIQLQMQLKCTSRERLHGEASGSVKQAYASTRLNPLHDVCTLGALPAALGCDDNGATAGNANASNARVFVQNLMTSRSWTRFAVPKQLERAIE